MAKILSFPSERFPQIKVVTLDNFYETIDEPRAQTVFMDMMVMRARGFRNEYSPSFLPLDKVDFFARHQVFYIQETVDAPWRPLGCYKQVLASCCQFYAYEFPLISFMKSVQAEKHLEAFHELSEQASRNQRDILYGGGLTLDKKVRTDPQTKELVHELLTGLLYADCVEMKNPICVTAAALRFKIDFFFEKVGYRHLSHQDQRLPSLPIISAANEPTSVMAAEQMTAYAKECYDKYHRVIKNRECIGSVVINPASKRQVEAA